MLSVVFYILHSRGGFLYHHDICFHRLRITSPARISMRYLNDCPTPSVSTVAKPVTCVCTVSFYSRLAGVTPQNPGMRRRSIASVGRAEAVEYNQGIGLVFHDVVFWMRPRFPAKGLRMRNRNCIFFSACPRATALITSGWVRRVPERGKVCCPPLSYCPT
jgi:hypothetical protein